MSATLSFWGAAETVTGSKYLLEVGARRILVDCGLFQGLKKLRLLNREPLALPADQIDAVVLTHAHIDHSGYLPALVKQGFEGPIYCTRATRDLLQILLPDAGYLQEEEAKFLNRHGLSKHTPALPLYTRLDADRALDQLVAVDFAGARGDEPGADRRGDERLALGHGVSVEFRSAGHILGAAWLDFDVEGKRLVFSGDLGRPADPVMRPPQPIAAADYLVCESTYGDRRHPRNDLAGELAGVIRRTIEREGTVLIPSFAVGRAQTLMHLITTLRDAGDIPDVPIYLDSPMAISATELFINHHDLHRLTEAQCRRMSAGVEFTRTPQESMRIDQSTEPAIVIAASGMATGGRVIHHMKVFCPDPRHTLLFVGFQAAGTRGDALVKGADEVKIHGQYIPVRCDVVNLQGLSAHADHAEIGDWLDGLEHAPRRVFLTHGEPAAADAQRRYLRDRFGWEAEIPELGDVVEL